MLREGNEAPGGEGETRFENGYIIGNTLLLGL